MSYLDHVRLMATYNDWMNGKIYDAAERMTDDELWRDRGAFFGSIAGTMNHLLVTDIMWLHRFAGQRAASPALDPVMAMAKPTALDEILYSELPDMREARETVDRAILQFAETLEEPDLAVVMSYTRAGGHAERKQVHHVLSHVFNHQTHHRGQLSTLFCQAGIDIGVTDVNALTPNLG
jgi:uncharacterized damage-inducible protein DinB